ncbi:transposase [Weissella thailandensis]|nr:transposase [Weissella thailandensis]NKY90244.1 transposase [Weissella thailandensis]
MKIVLYIKLSNGPGQANNKIKAIKRTAYGFRNFKLFHLRILIAFKDSFYSQNYTKSSQIHIEFSCLVLKLFN